MRLAILVVLMVSASWALADEASIATGKELYGQTCIACHGANGKGAIPGVADLTKRDGALAKSDDELLKSITEGFQSPGSPLAMPAKGGNPTLTNANIQALLEFLRSEFGS